MNELVTVITPCYNAARFIRETIESVISQTYTAWEMLIIDDCSTDGSASIIKEYADKDSRIKYFKTDQPSGSPVVPRNIGLKMAKGRYIAFLDADDVYLPTKLANQISAFDDKDIAIVFSNYEKMTADGTRSNRIISAPSRLSYRQLLKSGYIGCCTLMYDSAKTGSMEFSSIGHEDWAFALSILKKGYIAKNTNTAEAIYRLVGNSRSSQKFKVIKWQWHILREVEKLSLWRAAYNFSCYAILGVIKYLK